MQVRVAFFTDTGLDDRVVSESIVDFNGVLERFRVVVAEPFPLGIGVVWAAYARTAGKVSVWVMFIEPVEELESTRTLTPQEGTKTLNPFVPTGLGPQGSSSLLMPIQTSA